MDASKSAKTISDIFEEFLADQKGRISHKTFLKYESIISLYKSDLESYWPDHDGESDKIIRAGGTYCGTYGPEDATVGYSEFLGYFMPRKVMCGKETMQAAGTVTKKLAKWLAEKGYLKDTEDAQEQQFPVSAEPLEKARFTAGGFVNYRWSPSPLQRGCHEPTSFLVSTTSLPPLRCLDPEGQATLRDAARRTSLPILLSAGCLDGWPCPVFPQGSFSSRIL